MEWNGICKDTQHYDQRSRIELPSGSELILHKRATNDLERNGSIQKELLWQQ